MLNMILGVTVWNHRIAPVFDSAGTLLVLEVEGGVFQNSKTVNISKLELAERSELLMKHQVQELICGAISREAEAHIRMYGIQILSFIAGDIDQVLQAWHRRILCREEFSMPGCGHAHRRHRHGRSWGRGRGISS